MKNAGQHNGEHLLENKAQEETGQVKRMTQRYHQFRVSISNPLPANPQLILDHTFQFNTIEGTTFMNPNTQYVTKSNIEALTK